MLVSSFGYLSKSTAVLNSAENVKTQSKPIVNEGLVNNSKSVNLNSSARDIKSDINTAKHLDVIA